MNEVKLVELENQNKKYKAIFYNNGMPKKTVYFGDGPSKDYTLYHAERGPKFANERKRLYLVRHKKRENWKDFSSAGALSRWILWNKKTRQASINDYLKRFKLKLIK